MNTKNVVTLAIGSAFLATVALAPVAHAADNPFAMKKLEAGYQLAAADEKMKDGSCGADKKKDGSCGADKKAAEKTAADKKKDGKCGEAKCGADKKKM